MQATRIFYCAVGRGRKCNFDDFPFYTLMNAVIESFRWHLFLFAIRMRSVIFVWERFFRMYYIFLLPYKWDVAI